MTNENWTEIFPYASPYSHQADAIERALEILEENGYFAMEGPCGTGKTAVSLTAGITKLRNDPNFTRILAVTPVKQQLQQFVNELRTHNEANTESSIVGIELAGRRDLHPYLREDICEEIDESLTDLRETTRKVLDFDSGPPIYPQAELPLDNSSIPNQASLRLQKDRAEIVYRGVQRWMNENDIRPLRTANVQTALPATPPRINQLFNLTQDDLPDEVTPADRIDPFYIGFKRHGSIPFGCSIGDKSVLDRATLVKESLRENMCPHLVMIELGTEASIVLGNYSHLLRHSGRIITEKMGILSDNTILVVDEAHQLPRRARAAAEDKLGYQTLETALRQVRIGRRLLRRGTVNENAPDDLERSRAIQGLLRREHEIDANQLAQAFEDIEAVCETTIDFLNSKIETFLDNDSHINQEYTSWRQQWPSMQTSAEERTELEEALSDKSIPLRDPEELSTDDLTERLATIDAETEDTLTRLFNRYSQLDRLIKTVFDMHPDAPEGNEFGSVVRKLKHWQSASAPRYYQEIKLEPTSSNINEPAWRAGYNAALTLYQCLPASELAEYFAELGGGIVMSATLAPLDIYTEVSGLETFADEEDRPVETETYGLQFPEENRASWRIALNKYTHKNRRVPTADDSEMTPTRQQYAGVLRNIARSRGNILVAMPSYREAEWAHDVLQKSASVSKQVYLDQSSSARETETLLERFFSNGYGVIVTSARGTITEGVDYAGEKLHLAAVVGVPIPRFTDRSKAVRAAYDQQYDGKGFEYAYAVPAVRKARQTIGRVIRSEEDIGVRILIDERYVGGCWGSVNAYLSPQEREEFTTVGKDALGLAFDRFWEED